jgi:prepilin-type N-terminal cleavage/methylation domain-containing protein
MVSREDGFSLTELLVAMSVFLFVIAAATGIFIPLVGQFKQQGSLAETNIEGAVGLELLRMDIEHAGYGVPWSFQEGISYDEAVSFPASAFNDAPHNTPREVFSSNNMTFPDSNSIFNGADYLVIRSTIVGNSETAQKWTYIRERGNPRTWESGAKEDLPPLQRDLQNGEGVIVMRPQAGDKKLKELVVGGGAFFTSYSSSLFPAAFSPSRPSESFLIYGVSPSTPLRMPFNRADYFVHRFDEAGNDIVPRRCAQKTGVLEKAVVNNTLNADGGKVTNYLSLLDCVADFQVAFGLDTTSPPGGICYTNDLGNLLNPIEAMEIRDRVKELRLYILLQEGRYDINYSLDLNAYNTGLLPAIGCPTCIRVGRGNTNTTNCSGEAVLGRDFDLATIPDWQHYRWKVYTLVVRPDNLR